MTPQELLEYKAAVAVRHGVFVELAEQLSPASSETESDDSQSDALAEAFFLRAFTAYERDIEKLFLHYVTGGTTLNGQRANTYLSTQDEILARRITKAGYKFLNWAKPQDIRATAENYIEAGWPIVDMVVGRSQELADCEKIRNRIAHSSIEAVQQFNAAQRNMLGTERVFDISPGQFLRIRNTRLRKLHISYYLDAIKDTLEAIIDPPAI